MPGCMNPWRFKIFKLNYAIPTMNISISIGKAFVVEYELPELDPTTTSGYIGVI